MVFKSKAKGSAIERKFMHLLYGKGFQVLRAAGSGTMTLPSFDVIAAKKGKIFIFELKSKNSEYLSVPKTQMEDFSKWAKAAKAEKRSFVVWYVRGKFYLIKKEQFSKSKRFYNFKKRDLDRTLKLESFLSANLSK
jgi:Holliday junction resolvase